MLLAIDIGNTHTSFALMEDGKVVLPFRVRTTERTADEIVVLLGSLLEGRRVSAALACSVVPGAVRAWEEAVGRSCAVRLAVVGRGVKLGLRLRTDNPRELGSDRVVNALSAKLLVGAPCIAVDVGGTAITVDCVNTEGDYVGGVIAPGLLVSAAGLYAGAPQLPRVELEAPGKVLGRNTKSAIQSGLVLGFAGLVDGLVGQCLAELGEANVVATGGMAKLLLPHSDRIERVEPHLTLLGLAAIAG